MRGEAGVRVRVRGGKESEEEMFREHQLIVAVMIIKRK